MITQEYSTICFSHPEDAPIPKSLNNLRHLLQIMFHELEDDIKKKNHETNKEEFNKKVGAFIKFIERLELGPADSGISQLVASIYFVSLYRLIGSQFAYNPEWIKYFSKNRKFWNISKPSTTYEQCEAFQYWETNEEDWEGLAKTIQERKA